MISISSHISCPASDAAIPSHTVELGRLFQITLVSGGGFAGRTQTAIRRNHIRNVTTSFRCETFDRKRDLLRVIEVYFVVSRGLASACVLKGQSDSEDLKGQAIAIIAELNHWDLVQHTARRPLKKKKEKKEVKTEMSGRGTRKVTAVLCRYNKTGLNIRTTICQGKMLHYLLRSQYLRAQRWIGLHGDQFELSLSLHSFHRNNN